MSESYALNSYQLDIPGYTRAEADALFLKLDCSNDPLTENLLFEGPSAAQFRNGNSFVYSGGDGSLTLVATNKVLMTTNDIQFGKNNDSDITLDFVSTTNDGQFKWMEDEDYFQFNDDILMSGTESLYFGVTTCGINYDGGVCTFQNTGGNTTISCGGTLTLNPASYVYVGDGTNTDFGFYFNGADNDGILKWMEDENYFDFNKGVVITGDLGLTGSRVTKGWFTDIESTNMPTVGGTSIQDTFDARYLLESNNLSDLDDAGTARTNLGLVAGGVGDIWVEKAGDTMTGALNIHGSADTNQLVVRANATQSNTNPLILLEASDGTDIMSIHSDAVSNLFLGIDAGRNNAVSGAEGTYNTFLGYGAGYSNTSGEKNLAIGGLSGYYNETGDNNICIGKEAYVGTSGNSASNQVAIGYYTLKDNTTGHSNIAIGAYALRNNTTGTYNAGIGRSALFCNETSNFNLAIGYFSQYLSTAEKNTSIGYYSMYENTTGTQNLAIGEQAARYNQTGSYNISIGNGAGRGASGNSHSYNTFMGYRAGYDITTGGSNVALGSSALANLTSGSNNMSIGVNTLLLTTTQSGNVAVGTSALYNNTAAGNLALGHNAGYTNSTGADNIFIGSDSGKFKSTGSSNICIGDKSGQGTSGQSAYANNTLIGVQSGLALTTGSNNLLFGYLTGDNLTTGANNILIGYDLNASAVDVSNELNIGNLLKGDTSAKTVVLDGDVTIGSGAADKDYTLIFDGETNDCTITWYEDEDQLYIDKGVEFGGYVNMGGSFFPRQVDDDGMDATDGTEGEIVYNQDDNKFYGCTVTGTPATWSALN